MNNVQGFSTAMLSIEYDIIEQCSDVQHYMFSTEQDIN